MKRLLLAALLAAAAASPIDAQTAISTDATGGYVGFPASLTSPSGGFRRGLIQAVTCVDPSGNYTGCTGSGGGGSGSNAAAYTIGSSNPTTAGVTGYVGSDGKVYGWAGDTAGHPAVSIFGTLPGFATTPTFNIGTAPTITVQGTASALNATVVGTGTFAVQNTAAIPAGANSIGTVGLNAGSAIVGKFGIDQTTPGTTNGVVLNAGTNSVGSVGLNAGTNTIGGVIGNSAFTDSTTNLAANASVNGTGRAPPAWASYYTCSASSNVAGTLSVNYVGQTRPLATIAAVAGATTFLPVRIMTSSGLMYCAYANGATAQSDFALLASFTAN